jgi:hypothetical protein
MAAGAILPPLFFGSHAIRVFVPEQGIPKRTPLMNTVGQYTRIDHAI